MLRFFDYAASVTTCPEIWCILAVQDYKNLFKRWIRAKRKFFSLQGWLLYFIIQDKRTPANSWVTLSIFQNVRSVPALRPRPKIYKVYVCSFCFITNDINRRLKLFQNFPLAQIRLWKVFLSNSVICSWQKSLWSNSTVRRFLCLILGKSCCGTTAWQKFHRMQKEFCSISL